MIRTFIAVEVASEAREKAAELMETLRTCGARISWTKPHNLHLTLKFLGDTPEARLVDVGQAVASAAAESPVFSLQLIGAGAFPDPRRPQTLWIGVEQGREAACRLAATIDESLHRQGFPREKRGFQPHLTIGRVRGGSANEKRHLGKLLVEHERWDCGVCEVREVLVMSSELSPAGPTYGVLQRCPLATAPASTE